jgi:hypothetical protein
VTDTDVEMQLRQTLHALARNADQSAARAEAAIRERLTEPARRSSSRRWPAAAASGLAMAVIAGAAFALAQANGAGHHPGSRNEGTARPAAGGFASARINAMPVPIWPDQLVVIANAIWVGGNKPGSTEGRLVRVNPGTGSIVADIPVGRQPAGLAVSATDVWVTSNADDSVSRVSIRRSAVVATIHTPGPPIAVAISPGAVWIVSSSRDSATLTRVDPATGRVVANISVPPAAMDVVYAGHALWVASELNGGALTKVDPVSGSVLLSMRLPNIRDPYDLAVLGDTLAVVGENNRALDLVSMPAGKVKASIPLPFYTAAVSADAHAVYVASNGRTVARFPVSSSGSVSSRSPITRTLPSVPGAMSTGLGSVWFASNNTLIRIPAS